MGAMRHSEESSDSADKVMSRLSVHHKRHLSAERIVGMSDNVFAVVMTLMLISVIQDLSTDSINPSHLNEALVHLGPKFCAFLISFFVIGTIWVTDNVVTSLKSIDIPYLWMRLIYLLLVTCMGLTSTLLGVYHADFSAHLLFGLNMACTYLVILISWNYALRNGLLILEHSAALNRAIHWRSVFALCAYTLGSLLAYWNPTLSFLYFLVIAISMAVLQLVTSFQWVTESMEAVDPKPKELPKKESY